MPLTNALSEKNDISFKPSIITRYDLTTTGVIDALIEYSGSESNIYLVFTEKPKKCYQKQFKAYLSGKKGGFIPKCSKSGQYAPMQCYKGKLQ